MKSRSVSRLIVVSLLVLGVCAIVARGFSRASLAQDDPVNEPRYFAIKGARIVPVSGAPIENGTVVVADGIIKAVGADATIPPEAAVIDGKGLTVYPGLIDAGTNVGLPAPEPPQMGPARGRRAPRPMPSKLSMGPEDRPGTTPWNVAANDLNSEDPRIENWRSAGFTTALVEPEGGMFPGQGSIIDFGSERAGNMVVKPHATLDISFEPTGGFFSFPGSLMGVIAYVRQVFIDTRWYQDADAVYSAHHEGIERPSYDRTEVVVGQALKDNELVLLPANEKLRIYRAIRLANEWQIHAAMYGGQEGYEMSSEIAQSKMPVFVNVNWPTMPKDADTDNITLRELRLWDRAPSTPAALSKAGVLYAFYSGGLTNPKDILKNVKKAIDKGLSPDDALRAMTENPAQILGVEDRLGSIAPGKIANLVVADGDLFDEKTKIKDVFVDGMRYQIHEETPPPGPPDHSDKPSVATVQMSEQGAQQ
ncbi:MAG TPA: amidohydrolase family protein [Candidatus Acidoferrales bacterium]|nr:amidohydrolase family protein [Candidatus Acidoferrales bacterium]